MSFIVSLWLLFFKSDLFSKLLVAVLFFIGIILILAFIYGLLKLHFKKKSACSLLKKIQNKEDVTYIEDPLVHFLIYNKEKQKNDEDLFFLLILEYISFENKLKNFFGLAASVSPLLGLLGTIWGIMHVFLSLEGYADLAAIAPGIAEALITTLAGLFVAIPGLCAYHFFGYLIRSYCNKVELIYLYYQ